MKHRPYYDVPISEIKVGDLIRLARYDNSKVWVVRGIKRLPDGYTLTLEGVERNRNIDDFYFDLNKRIYKGEKNERPL